MENLVGTFDPAYCQYSVLPVEEDVHFNWFDLFVRTVGCPTFVGIELQLQWLSFSAD